MNALTKNKYFRPVTAIERYNLVINELHYYNVDFIIEGEGHFKLDEWRSALKLVGEANPSCRVRFKSYLGFSKWVDSGIAPEVREIDSNGWDGRSSEGAEFMAKKFDVLKGGPVCEVLLMNGNPSRVIFRCCHGAFDGRGIEHIGHEVFRALRGEALLGSRSTVTDQDIRYLHRENAPDNIPPAVAAIPVIQSSEPDGEAPSYIWRRLTVAKKITNLLPKVAVFLADYARQSDSGNVLFTIPVDFRGLRTDETSTGNLTGYLKIQVDDGDSPKSVMRRINQQIREYRDCYSPSYLKVLPWIPISLLSKKLKSDANRLLHTVNDELPSAGIVSFGYINLEDWTYKDFQANVGYGIPGAVGKLNVVLHNFTDSTEIIFRAPKTYNDKGQLDEMINACEKYFL